MKIKQIIIFILLTIVLVVCSYIVLDILDSYSNYFPAIAAGIIVIADIALMGSIFLRFMKSSNSHRQ